jgi:hypothetical protein
VPVAVLRGDLVFANKSCTDQLRPATRRCQARCCRVLPSAVSQGDAFPRDERDQAPGDLGASGMTETNPVSFHIGPDDAVDTRGSSLAASIPMSR